jgi:protein-S-isoprenylcysteine O-methyltransferase Ste14
MYFVVMPRVNLIVILVMYVRYLYFINCLTVICLPSMLLFILWRDATSELWTPIQFPLHCFTILLLLALCTLLALLLSFYHSIRSILCLQQTGKIDNLIVSCEQSTYLCCVQVSRCCWVKTHQQYSCRHCLECHKSSKHHLLKFGYFSYWFDKPWFHN